MVRKLKDQIDTSDTRALIQQYDKEAEEYYTHCTEELLKIGPNKKTQEVFDILAKQIIVYNALTELRKTDLPDQERIDNFHKTLLTKLNANDNKSILATHRDNFFMSFIRKIGLLFGYDGETKGLKFMKEVGMESTIQKTIDYKGTLKEMILKNEPKQETIIEHEPTQNTFK